MKRIAAGLTVAALVALLVPASASANFGSNVRFATFNASLNRATAGQLVTDLSTPDNAAGPEGRRGHPAQPARRPC